MFNISRYILVLIILFILEILNHFSYFAQPSRPIEYYDNNIDKVNSAFDIINYIDKVFVSLLLIVYLKITSTLIDRENKEFSLLTDFRSESSTNRLNLKNKYFLNEKNLNKQSQVDSIMNYDNEINNSEIYEKDLNNQDIEYKNINTNNNNFRIEQSTGIYNNIYNNNYAKTNVSIIQI